MQAFDGQIELQAVESSGETSASHNLSRDALPLSRAGGQRAVTAGSTIETVMPSEVKGSGVKAFANPVRPSMISDIGVGWQRDGKGNSVIMGSFGKLLTRDHNGHLVDYEKHVDATRAAERNQMALTSLFFCSPLMLLGLGASFAIMDQFHISNRQKTIDQLKSQLEGKSVGGNTAKEGYRSDLVKKAMLMAYQGRGLSSVPDANGLIGMGARRFDERKTKRKEDFTQPNFRSNRISMPRDNYLMSTTRMIKERRKLENLIEQSRGKVSLQEASRLQSRLETLDRALTRLSNLSM